jgi:hypothetical protein
MISVHYRWANNNSIGWPVLHAFYYWPPCSFARTLCFSLNEWMCIQGLSRKQLKSLAENITTLRYENKYIILIYNNILYKLDLSRIQKIHGSYHDTWIFIRLLSQNITEDKWKAATENILKLVKNLKNSRYYYLLPIHNRVFFLHS